MTSNFLKYECPIFFLFTTGVGFKWQEPGKDRDHQCTCKTDQASVVLLKILSSPSCENVRALQFPSADPSVPVRDRCRLVSSPLLPALTWERLASTSHILWRIPQIKWQSYATGTLFRITAFWITNRRIVLEKEELSSWEVFIYP